MVGGSITDQSRRRPQTAHSAGRVTHLSSLLLTAHCAYNHTIIVEQLYTAVRFVPSAPFILTYDCLLLQTLLCTHEFYQNVLPYNNTAVRTAAERVVLTGVLNLLTHILETSLFFKSKFDLKSGDIRPYKTISRDNYREI